MYFKQRTINLFLIINILFGTTLLNASNYDDDTLNIFSKILPRFIMMSSQKEKIKENIEICILNDNIDSLVATSLINKVKNNYPNGIKNYNINFITSSYKSLNKCENTQLVFMFNSNKENIHNAFNLTNKYQILSMSYDEVLLKDGVNISLFIGRKVVPHLNMQSIKKSKIELNNILLRVSKIYAGTEK